MFSSRGFLTQAAAAGLITVALAFSTVACAGDKLTNSLAQKAVDKWVPSDGQKHVVGVVDGPQMGWAQADLQLKNFVYNSPKNDAITAYAFGQGGGRQTYNGAATATFKHYNDGRWILLSITGPGFNFSDLNIEVK